ncbi:MAG: pyridoxamine kinase [Clostridia bacterium]|nr:pyridoxamine kinase [Clostridia bacterium]
MQKRILTIQDISCVGQCSLTVALPIISACGVETCILPSAVLSTHTGGFSGFTFRDLTEDMPLIEKHWQAEKIKFDGIYTGYLGSAKQIDYVKSIFQSCMADDGVKIVDPAMADNGKLYVGFDHAFVEKMKTLCATADVILPNLTEACLLIDEPYPETYDEPLIDRILTKLSSLCKDATIVLTGIGYKAEKTGVIVYAKGEKEYYEHRKISKGCHGTGDIYASAFVGALMRGKSYYESAKIAADYTVACIEATQDDPSHWYGARFETSLPKLITALEK